MIIWRLNCVQANIKNVCLTMIFTFEHVHNTIYNHDTHTFFSNCNYFDANFDNFNGFFFPSHGVFRFQGALICPVKLRHLPRGQCNIHTHAHTHIWTLRVEQITYEVIKSNWLMLKLIHFESTDGCMDERCLAFEITSMKFCDKK